MIMDYHNHCIRQNNVSDDWSDEDDNLEYSVDSTELDKKLILTVKLYPCLYMKKRNKNQIQDAWNKVADAMNENVENCQVRWKRLRQYFCKEHQKLEKYGADKCKLIYYDLMKFLNPHVYKRRNVLKSSIKKSREYSTELQLQDQFDNLSNTQSQISDNCVLAYDIDKNIHNYDIISILQETNNNSENPSLKNDINRDTSQLEMSNIVLPIYEPMLSQETCTETEITSNAHASEFYQQKSINMSSRQSPHIFNILPVDLKENIFSDNDIAMDVDNESLDKQALFDKNLVSSKAVQKNSASELEKICERQFKDLTNKINDAFHSENKLKVSQKDEENKIIANLVLRRLKKITDNDILYICVIFQRNIFYCSEHNFILLLTYRKQKG